MFPKRNILSYYYKMSQKNSFKLLFALITILLFFLLMSATSYMFQNNYIAETFTSGTTHNVDLPINTTYSCKNMCGPPGRCHLTGTQCLSDIDCFGCQPDTSSDLNNSFMQTNRKIIGDDAAGKKSFLAPLYSPLTHDSVYNSKKIMISDPYRPPPEYRKGFDTWTTKAADMREVYDFTYQPADSTPYISRYPTRYSVTGQFRYTGPYASNASLRPYYESKDTNLPKKL